MDNLPDIGFRLDVEFLSYLWWGITHKNNLYQYLNKNTDLG